MWRAFSGGVAGAAVTRGLPTIPAVVHAGGGRRGRGEALRAVDALRFRNDGVLRVGQFVAWQIGGGVSSEKSQGRLWAVFVCHFWRPKPAAKPVLAFGGPLSGLGASAQIDGGLIRPISGSRRVESA